MFLTITIFMEFRNPPDCCHRHHFDRFFNHSLDTSIISNRLLILTMIMITILFVRAGMRPDLVLDDYQINARL